MDTKPLTDEMLRDLMHEAGAAGDLDTHVLATKALEGEQNAREECAAVITAALAMTDTALKVIA